MKKSGTGFLLLIIAGVAVAVAGLLLDGIIPKQVSGVMLGVGAGLAGMSLSNYLVWNTERKNPAIMKQAEIERRDERNGIIRSRAKAKAGDITKWLVMALAYVSILLSAPLWVTLVIVGVFLFYEFTCLYFYGKYQKEM